MNRLAQETSPYLLQHADNPVDWYPWGPEALEQAKVLSKPILLSVGYSACHWCHVMAHECFENDAIAKLMNENFICIKVDREERPDLDQIYQNVAQMLTHSGGWPLTVFLTPELKPFYGGTYFPPNERHGRPGFPRLLVALANAYKTGSSDVAENAARMTEAIGKMEKVETSENRRADKDFLVKAALELLESVDWKNGGFGGAPKFPNPMGLTFLWRMFLVTGNGPARDAVVLALSKMADGGIYDHLGGGFSRYSVDNEWAVPHFEKMLYDNALLIKLFSEVLLTENGALSALERTQFTRVVKETVEYVLREMYCDEGRFYSAQDADSLDEHGHSEEGAFFVWTPERVRAILSKEDAEIFERYYGVTPTGNFENGYTVLSVKGTVPPSAEAKEKCFNVRSTRSRPGLDDKSLCSWNALMISALAWASRLDLDGLESKARETALTVFDFITEQMSPSGKLQSVYARGRARFPAYLDDYSFAAMAALDLGKTEQAKQWIKECLDRFEDSEAGGFFFTSSDHEKLIARPKTAYDQAIPSGTSVTIEVLTVLSVLLDNGSTHEEKADWHLYKLLSLLERSTFGMAELANAALLHLIGPITITNSQPASPFVFLKQDSGTKTLFCHGKTCTEVTNAVDLRAKILEKTRLQ